MIMNNVSLVIPTIRLRDVKETAEAYAANFSRYGHKTPILIFDDSDAATSERYVDSLETISNRDAIYYIGHSEKTRFIKILQERSCVDITLLRKILKPSYGGNRNFTILYTLGNLFLSADDDIRPHGLLHKNRQPLDKKEVSKGLYIDKTDPHNEIEQRDYDIMGAYLDVLGKRVGSIEDIDRFLLGSTLVDSMTDLYTNRTLGPLKPNTISLVDGQVDPEARVVTAQAFRSGSADVDAIDYANDFLINPYHAFVNDMSMRYVLQGFTPVITKTNWRLDCGISGYDNTHGMPPFFPTELRFEDYIFRIWLQHPEMAAAHVGAAQTHYRNPYMRASIPADMWNEEMANFLKPRLKEEVQQIDKTHIKFNGDIHVSEDEARNIMEAGKAYYMRAINRAADVMTSKSMSEPLTPEQHSNYLIGFARDLFEQYSGFSLSDFYEHMKHTVSDEVEMIIRTMEVWPTILEATEKIKRKGRLPMRKI